MKILSALLLAIGLASCASSSETAQVMEEAVMSLSISSDVFEEGKPIPMEYSCDGRGISPALTWSGAPAGTQSFAMIMDDPDAPMGTFVHWVIYNIPPSTTGMPAEVPFGAVLPDGSIQGPGTPGSRGYIPPCPPGGTHRYFFKLYALNTVLDIKDANKEQLLKAMDGHILAQGELMGTYTR
jgi:Raf kinase inhibitor-like YbhB/YbcL family protein